MVQCYSTDDVNVPYEGTLALLANTIEFVHPLAHSSPQPKGQIDRLSRFAQLTAKSPYNGRPYSPELPLQMGNLDHM